MAALADLAARVLAHFEGVHADVFRGDPAANPRLKVEVLDPEMAGDTPTLVLITPWTLNGMAFPPDGARGDEEIRTQINADHTEADIDHVLALLAAYRS